MPDQPKVVITDYDFGDLEVERSILEPAGIRVVGLQVKSEQELIPEARSCDAVINQYAQVGAATIAAMERCKVIARYGVGVDIVDVEAATARNILVTNVRDYCTEEVADHAMALLLALARRLPQYDRASHAGTWHWKSGRPIHRLHGRVIGVVSFGRIGRAIAARGKAFGLRVIAYDPNVDDAVLAAHGAERADRDAVIAESDYLMMQVPMTPETRHFLGEAELGRMKRGAIIINTGRGPTIDNAALAQALQSGHIAAAGLDDLEEEPAKRRAWEPASNPLMALDNVLVTPHSAYYSEESIHMAREVAAQEVLRVLTSKRPHNPVNRVRLADGSYSRSA
ncbi:MAG TPA: C-terminal binding protein [Dongiaceae bacterium]|jgi:D-3-phosphoglycerate dehydrogenase|nr:C-terminal binding protein [Dongiaceae bacterium]